MLRTRSSYIPLARSTAGASSVDPSGALGKASRGILQDFPEGLPPSPPILSPAPLLSTQEIDGNGTQRLLSDDIVSLLFIDAHQESFANPDREYTGYAADGSWYSAGVVDASAAAPSWYSEAGAAGPDRGVLAPFPARIIVVGTFKEIAIFDADTLNLWMRFTIDLISPPANGPFAGGPSTVIREVSYAGGYLAVACNDGLRVANFRGDRGDLLTSSGVTSSIGGLSLRNSDTFFDGAASVDASRALQNTECLSLSSKAASLGSLQAQSTRGLRVVAAVGHPDGLTAVILDGTSSSVEVTRKHPARLDVATGWAVEDDGNLDTSSPYFVDDAFGATNWAALGASPGDVLSPDVGIEHVVTLAESIAAGRRLSVSPELGLTETGAAYSIQRPVGAVRISPSMHLYFANGLASVAVVRDVSWATTSGSVFSSLLVSSGKESLLDSPVVVVNSLEGSSTGVYAATGIGVFHASDADLDSKARATLLYATPSLESPAAKYPVLGGELNCIDVALDPETGNLLVAVTDSESVITEVTLGPEHAFRSFDGVGVVRALLAYRNPNESIAVQGA